LFEQVVARARAAGCWSAGVSISRDRGPAGPGGQGGPLCQAIRAVTGVGGPVERCRKLGHPSMGGCKGRGSVDQLLRRCVAGPRG